ncbi:MAG: SCO family protein [Proteobacteria bacterium]|nr:SCO family protein [Pseudomonadota bacterium]
MLLWSHADGFQALTAERARLEAARSTPPVAPFTVETMDGTVLRVPRVNGRVALVEFIYTRCPTLCQSAGADMKRPGAQLETR